MGWEQATSLRTTVSLARGHMESTILNSLEASDSVTTTCPAWRSKRCAGKSHDTTASRYRRVTASCFILPRAVFPATSQVISSSSLRPTQCSVKTSSVPHPFSNSAHTNASNNARWCGVCLTLAARATTETERLFSNEKEVKTV